MSRPSRRTGVLIGLVCGTGILLAGCAAPEADSAPTAAPSEQPEGTPAPEATALPTDPALAEFCAAGEAMYALSLPETREPTVDFVGKMADAFGALAAVAPPELTAGAELMTGVYVEMERVYREVGITGSTLPEDIEALNLSDAQKQQLAQAATAGFGDAFGAASAELVSRLADDCGVGADPVG